MNSVSSDEGSKTKSAENLSSPAVSPTPDTSSEICDATDALAVPKELPPKQGAQGTRVRTGSRGAGGRIDWKIFQEAVRKTYNYFLSSFNFKAPLNVQPSHEPNLFLCTVCN